MAAELPRPGVEVIQVFRSVSPTVITPTLPPCCVGVCRQIVDVLSRTATGGTTLNNDALVSLNAGFLAKAAVGDPAVYAGLDGKKLVLSINGAPNLTITFVGTPLTPKQIVAQVLAAFAAASVTAATAAVVGSTKWRLYTVAASESQSIKVISGGSTTDSEVLSAFGLGANKVYAGASGYGRDAVVVATSSFPDPRHNLSQLSIDSASVRAFLFMGGTNGTLTEVHRDRTFLRSAIATPAVLTGTVDLSGIAYGGSGDLNGLTLIFTFNGGSTPLTVTFGAPADLAAALVAINAVISAVATATVNGSSHLVVTTLLTGGTAQILVGAGTANATVGISPGSSLGAPAIKSIDAGTSPSVTPLLQAPGADFTASATAAVVTGTVSIAGGVTNGQTLVVDDGTGPQTLVFSGANNSANTLAAINALFGSAASGLLMATVNGSTHLVLTHSLLGRDSVIVIVGGTALTALGLTAGTTYGNPYPPVVGDDIYVNGSFLGTITQVAPNSNVDQLKIDHQVPINASLGVSYYIVAKNLPATSRPVGDLTLDLNGNAIIKPDFIRDTQGFPITTVQAQVYLAYHAVRQDVSPIARSPGLLRFNDTIALGSQLSPVNADNPLALGLYFALLNAPGVQVTGLGVDAATASAPNGTVEAFARAATFLEGFDVYAIAPLTHDSAVGQLFDTHVTAMSAPEQKGERVVLLNPDAPVSKVDTLVGSGLNGNSTTSSNVFDTGIANLGALLLAKGVSPVGSLLVSDGVYLDVGDGKKYSITSITGSAVTVKTSAFASGDNDDGYYSVTTLPSTLIAQPFAIRIRGALLELTDGTPDKDGIALTYQALAQAYQNRRVWHVIPDQCAATIDGIEQVIDGFYMNAAVAGMIGKLPPQQSFTNYPMTGFTRVIGSNGFLSEKQLNIAAAGGNYIIVQDAQGTPLISRMALTTDMTSIETRTDSITKVVDFAAKFLRRGLKNFIGRFNITQGFLDSLGHVIQGLGGFLVESGVLVGFNLNNIIQDESAPDTVLIDCTLDVPFPCNYIRLTLVV